MPFAGDQASYIALSADVDQNPGTDFEKYFNNATLAVARTYGDPTTVEAHSNTITVSGHKSYDLDFQSAEVKGSYILTSTENGMYIFSFRVPNKPRAVQAFQDEIVDIYSSIRINPPAVIVTPHIRSCRYQTIILPSCENKTIRPGSGPVWKNFCFRQKDIATAKTTQIKLKNCDKKMPWI